MAPRAVHSSPSLFLHTFPQLYRNHNIQSRNDTPISCVHRRIHPWKQNTSNFRQPSNLYGPGPNFSPSNSTIPIFQFTCCEPVRVTFCVLHLPSSSLRDENRLLGSENASYSHGYPPTRERKQRLPESGGLVLVRNHAVDNQEGGSDWDTWAEHKRDWL